MNRNGRIEGVRFWHGAEFLGVSLALYVFMADALRTRGQGADALRKMLPTRFNWPLFLFATLLMAASIRVRLYTSRRSPERASRI